MSWEVGGFFDVNKSTGGAPYPCRSESWQQLTYKGALPLATIIHRKNMVHRKKVAPELGAKQLHSSRRRETHQPNNAISLLKIMLNTLLVC